MYKVKRIITPCSNRFVATFSKGKNKVLASTPEIKLNPNEEVIVLPMKSFLGKFRRKFFKHWPEKNKTIKFTNTDKTQSITVKAPYKKVVSENVDYLDIQSKKVQSVYAPNCNKVNAQNIKGDVNVDNIQQWANILYSEGNLSARGAKGRVCLNHAKGSFDGENSQDAIIGNYFKGGMNLKNAKGPFYLMNVNEANIKR